VVVADDEVVQRRRGGPHLKRTWWTEESIGTASGLWLQTGACRWRTLAAHCPVKDWIVQCLTSPPTQYRLYGRRFLQVKRPNQQYQSTEGSLSCQGLEDLSAK